MAEFTDLPTWLCQTNYEVQTMTTHYGHGIPLDALGMLQMQEFVEFYWDRISVLDTDKKDALRTDIQEEHGDDTAKEFVRSYNYMQENYVLGR